MAKIGEQQEGGVIEPLEDPVPNRREQPEHEPQREREPDEVPA